MQRGNDHEQGARHSVTLCDTLLSHVNLYDITPIRTLIVCVVLSQCVSRSHSVNALLPYFIVPHLLLSRRHSHRMRRRER
jgi:hypothetical protein